MPVSVEVRDGSMESLEFALRKFKKKMEVAKILDEYKAKQYFIKPSLAKREKRKTRIKYEQSRSSF